MGSHRCWSEIWPAEARLRSNLPLELPWNRELFRSQTSHHQRKLILGSLCGSFRCQSWLQQSLQTVPPVLLCTRPSWYIESLRGQVGWRRQPKRDPHPLPRSWCRNGKPHGWTAFNQSAKSWNPPRFKRRAQTKRPFWRLPHLKIVNPRRTRHLLRPQKWLAPFPWLSWVL